MYRLLPRDAMQSAVMR